MENHKEINKNNRGRILTDSRLKGIIIILAVLALWLGLAASVRAQMDSLKSGDRIRIMVPSMTSNRIIGTVSGISSSAILLITNRTSMTIPKKSIHRLEVSRGRKSNVGKFSLIGAAAGFFIVGAVTMESNSPPEPCKPEESPCVRWGFTDEGAFYMGALVGGVTGAAAGAFIGLMTKSDRWEERSLKVIMGLNAPSNNKRLVSPKVSLRINLK